MKFNIFNTFEKHTAQLFGKKVNGLRTGLLVFSPAIFFILLAFLVVLAPKLILFVFSTILLFFAFCCALVAYKFIQLKKQFNKMKGSIFAKGGNAQSFNPENYRAQIFVERAVKSKSTSPSIEDILNDFEGNSQSELKSKLEKILSDTKLMTEDEDGNIIEIIDGKKVMLH